MQPIEQFRDCVSSACRALAELTEDDSNPKVEHHNVRVAVMNDADGDVPAS